MTTKQIIAQIKKHQLRIEKERDALDDFISQLEGLRDSCASAVYSLHNARDALSELV